MYAPQSFGPARAPARQVFVSLESLPFLAYANAMSTTGTDYNLNDWSQFRWCVFEPVEPEPAKAQVWTTEAKQDLCERMLSFCSPSED